MWKQRGEKGEEKRNENREGGGLRDRTDEKESTKKKKKKIKVGWGVNVGIYLKLMLFTIKQKWKGKIIEANTILCSIVEIGRSWKANPTYLYLSR